MNRVAYWSNYPTPYVVERFNAVARRGNVRFEAWFSARRGAGRSWNIDEREWEFDHRYLPRVGVGRASAALPTSLLDRDVPQLIIGLHPDPAVLGSYPLFRLRGARTAFWVTATYDAWIARRRWKELVKRHAFRHVHGVLTTGRDGRAFALQYGASPDTIYELPHFVDFDYFSGQRELHEPSRAQIRAELAVSGVTFLYVGRLWTGKGVDDLLTAFADLQRESAETASLLLVGDGVDEARLRRRCQLERIDNVVFTGFRQRAELPRMYTASDVFVFPTLGDPFGHVVEEAMSSGLPVITTSAAGEIHGRVSDGESGFIVPPRRPDALFDRMRLLAADANLRHRMGKAGFERARGQTAEQWASAFEAAVDALLRRASRDAKR